MYKKEALIFLLFVIIVKMYFTITAFKNYSFNHENLLANGDAGHYFVIAQNLHNYQIYSDNDSTIATEFSTWRAPVYPLVLSVIMVFSQNAIIINIIKVLLELFCLLFILSKLKNKVSFAIYPFLFLILIEPQHLKYTNTILSESFTAVLLFATAIVFIFGNKKQLFLLPILAGILVLTHPISIFYCLILIVTYCLLVLKSSKKRIGYFLMFILIVFSWMFRNEMIFHKGFYITASQGATFSKGWNKQVATNFTNVDGDLADEGLNLKYLKTNIKPDISVLDLGKLYKKSTIEFIKQSSIKELATIVFVKLKSNFNPFPEKPKPGFLELLGSLFRVLYCMLCLQIVYRFIKKPKININKELDRVVVVVCLVIVSQVLISIFIYTGIRFNSVYGITLLFCFIFLNKSCIIENRIFKHQSLNNEKTLNSNSSI